MAVAVSYTPATNIMAVTGGTSSVPALMIDLVQKDFDTPLTLLSAAVIDADPDIMSLTTPVRARDSLALHLSITASANRAGATATIVGRNHLGDSVVETGLDIATALTTAVITANAYSQIYTVTFNGMTNGDTVTIKQPRLGVITAGLERDLVVNGGFDADASWGKETGWTIAGGVATCDGTQSQVTNLSLSSLYAGYPTGTIFRCLFSVLSVSAGTVRIRAGNYGLQRSSVRTFVEYLIWDNSNDSKVILGDADFIGSIDNVTVQKLTGQYSVGCNVLFGDGSTPTYFTSLNEMVRFDDGFYYVGAPNATLQLGELKNGRGVNGSVWATNISTGRDVFNSLTASFLCYGSKIYNPSLVYYQYRLGTFTFIDTIFEGGRHFWYSGTLHLEHVQLNSVEYVVISMVPIYIYDVSVSNCSTLATGTATKETQIDNIIITGGVILRSGSGVVNATNILNNLIYDSFTVSIAEGSTKLLSTYSTNIHVADKNGADLEAATVSLTSFGNIVSPDAGANFYRCIVGHTAGTFATDLAAGKWILTTAANAALAGVTGAAQAGAWVTGIAYTAAATEFSVATGASGDIAEQTVTYKKWIGMSAAMLSYSPHTLTVTKSGKVAATMENIVVSALIKYRLEVSGGGLIAHPGMSGGIGG